MANELRNASDETLTALQTKGTLTVCGHELSAQDVTLKYAFDSGNKNAGAHNYEAHSNGDVSCAWLWLWTIFKRVVPKGVTTRSV